MVELKGLQKSGEPKQPLTALDRQLLAADRWKWSHDEQNQLQIQVRFAEKGVWRTTQFGRGRFDFDRVSSVANDAQHVWLATDGGFFEIDPTIKNSFRPSDSLQMTAAANQPHFFSVWFEGSNKLFVDVDANTLLQFDGQQWGRH